MSSAPTCGARMVLSGGRYLCSRRKERGACTCSNSKVIKAETVEARVLDGVRTKLLAPDAIRQAVAAIGEAMLAEQRAIESERAPLEQELVQIERKLQRAQRMCLEEAISTAELKALSAPLKQRQTEIEGRLAMSAQAHIGPRPIVAAAAAALARSSRLPPRPSPDRRGCRRGLCRNGQEPALGLG
jgi:site-specific DNA recombinase